MSDSTRAQTPEFDFPPIIADGPPSRLLMWLNVGGSISAALGHTATLSGGMVGGAAACIMIFAGPMFFFQAIANRRRDNEVQAWRSGFAAYLAGIGVRGLQASSMKEFYDLGQLKARNRNRCLRATDPAEHLRFWAVNALLLRQLSNNNRYLYYFWGRYICEVEGRTDLAKEFGNTRDSSSNYWLPPSKLAVINARIKEIRTRYGQ